MQHHSLYLDIRSTNKRYKTIYQVNLVLIACEQRRFRRACAFAQSRQNLRYSLIQAVSQEEPSDRKPDPWPLWMAGHAQSKFVMTECSKTQIRLTRPRLVFIHSVLWSLLKISSMWGCHSLYEPRHMSLCLWAFRHDKFQLRMPSHSEGPEIWLSVWRFLLTPCLFERAANVLARLRRCAGSPEPSLLA